MFRALTMPKGCRMKKKGARVRAGEVFPASGWNGNRPGEGVNLQRDRNE